MLVGQLVRTQCRGIRHFMKYLWNISNYEIFSEMVSNTLTERYKARFRKRCERKLIYGDEIASATIILRYKGAVKFHDQSRWISREESLPTFYVPDLKIEAINASNTMFFYDLLEYIEKVQNLLYLDISNCVHVDDFVLDRLSSFSNTLEYLDVSGCPSVSEDGLATLHCFKKLKRLVASNMWGVENKDLIALLLEDSLPGTFIQGLYSPPPKQLETGL